MTSQAGCGCLWEGTRCATDEGAEGGFASAAECKAEGWAEGQALQQSQKTSGLSEMQGRMLLPSQVLLQVLQGWQTKYT